MGEKKRNKHMALAGWVRTSLLRAARVPIETEGYVLDPRVQEAILAQIQLGKDSKDGWEKKKRERDKQVEEKSTHLSSPQPSSQA